MEMVDEKTYSDLGTQWLAKFEKALTDGNRDQLSSLFLEVSYWRDVAALTWDVRQAHGRDAVLDDLLDVTDEMKPTGFRLAGDKPVPALAGAQVEVFFDFDTVAGRASGRILCEIEETGTSLKVFTLFTRLEELAASGWLPSHPRGHGFEREDANQNWLESRSAAQQYEGRSPEVLIVGAGHSGLIAAAHFHRLGVDALIIDKNLRVGDNWRNRYHNLALHNPVEMNHLPYLKFPDNFPEYIPKDKMGNWLETYVDSLDLNVWTSTELIGGTFDDETATWTVSVRRGDGSTRELNPKHVVLATGGVGGLPRIPQLEGIDSFAGPVMHSSKFPGGAEFAGKKAIVVGVGTSGHDIATDLYNHGAEVTMIQRSPIVVISLAGANLAYDTYWLTDDSMELIDYRIAAGSIYPLTVAGAQEYQRHVAELDKNLHERLEEAGMRLTEGEDKTGWLLKFFREAGSYYLNVGGSELVASGAVGLRQASDIVRYAEGGALFSDGSVLEADVVVLATGYQNRNSELEGLFGAEVAQKVGKVGGFDEVGELANAWKPTPQRGLWFMIGSMQQCRMNSRAMALLIKAELEGVIPDSRTPAAQHRQHSLERVV